MHSMVAMASSSAAKGTVPASLDALKWVHARTLDLEGLPVLQTSATGRAPRMRMMTTTGSRLTGRRSCRRTRMPSQAMPTLPRSPT